MTFVFDMKVTVTKDIPSIINMDGVEHNPKDIQIHAIDHVLELLEDDLVDEAEIINITIKSHSHE